MESLTTNSASDSASDSASASDSVSDIGSEFEGSYEEGGNKYGDDAIAVAADKAAGNDLNSLIREPSLRKEILKIICKLFFKWITTVKYIAPPEDRLPRTSHVNTSWFIDPEHLATLDCSPSAEKTQQVTAFRPDGYFHLACPFYAADQRTYGSCLLGSDLHSIAALLRHIRQNHMRKPYCALCHRDFDMCEERDAHMMQRRCKVVGHGPFKGDASRKGVSEMEVERLEETDMRSRDESEAQRWWNMFSALFPAIQAKKKTESVRSQGYDPYLRDGPGFAVSLVHDFWATQRKECVSRALTACGHDLGDASDRKALSALYKATRKELVAKIYHASIQKGL